MRNTAKLADGKERQRRAIQRRTQGWTWTAIAEDVGYSSATACCKAATKAMAAYPAPELDALRALESERLDALQSAVWDEAMAGGTDAAKVIIKIIEARCRLFGLNAPARVEVRACEQDAAIEALVVELLEMPGPR